MAAHPKVEKDPAPVVLVRQALGPDATFTLPSVAGKTLRLRGKGFTGKDGQRGDQLVTLLIDVPADDPVILQLVEDWQDGRAVRTHLGV